MIVDDSGARAQYPLGVLIKERCATCRRELLLTPRQLETFKRDQQPVEPLRFECIECFARRTGRRLAAPHN